jgi:hypothetical protein
VQAATASGLSSAVDTWGVLEISPPWDGPSGSTASPALAATPARGLAEGPARAESADQSAVAPVRSASVQLLPVADGAGAAAVAAAAAVGRPGLGGVWSGGGGSGDAQPTRLAVRVEPACGCFVAELRVPAGAQLQRYTVTLRLPDEAVAGTQPDEGTMAGWPVEAAQLAATVADPRPPTAELQVRVLRPVSGRYM